MATPARKKPRILPSGNIVSIDDERDSRDNAAREARAASDDAREARRAATDVIDPSYKNRRIIDSPLSCAGCSFYKKAGGFKKPCADIGAAADSPACNRYVTAIDRWSREAREPAIRVVESAFKAGITAAQLVSLAHSAAGLKSRRFGETVLIPITAGRYESGVVIGERAGKLHILNNRGMVAIISDTGLKAPGEVEMAITVAVKTRPDSARLSAPVAVAPRPKIRDSHISRGGVVSLRGGIEKNIDDDEMIDSPVAKATKKTVAKPAAKAPVAKKKRPLVMDEDEEIVVIRRRR